MGNEIANRDTGSAIAIPQSVASAFSGMESNINLGEQIPHISIKGKVWKMIIEGNETTLTMNVEGELTPRPTIKVVILNQVPKRSRAYFKEDYVEGSNVQPTCWSINGETPSVDVQEPVASACNKCDMAVKGSKINNEGKPTTACSQNKRICVIPSAKADFTALLLKLPVTSLWESEASGEAQGWFAFDAYLKFLKRNNVDNTAMVETMMKFDSDVAYPKVLFKYNGFIKDEAAAEIAGRWKSEDVMHVLGLDEELPDPSTKRAIASDVQKEEVVVEEETVVAASSQEETDDSGAFGEEEVVQKKATPKKKTVKKKAKAKVAPKETEAVKEVSDEEALADAMSGDWG